MIDFDGVNDYFCVFNSVLFNNGSMIVLFWVYLDLDFNVDGNNNWCLFICKGFMVGIIIGFDVVFEEWGNCVIVFDMGG